MKGPQTEFPLVQTKTPGVTDTFDLSNPEERAKYFEAKVGKEIAMLRNYFKDNTFIAYLLGKKNAGKGTYTRMMIDIFGEDHIGHISVGDVVRATYKIFDGDDEAAKQDIIDYLRTHYRGYISIEDGIDALLGRSQDKLLPTEFILILVQREIDKLDGHAIFIDGFPRDLDQVSYSLYFRNLINYRLDPDVFVAIDIPESVIDERMRNRVVCHTCHAPRNLSVFPTKVVGYDKDSEEYFLMCDTPECEGERMKGKEGDSAGIESIRARLDLDGSLIKKVMDLHGVPKILLRNSIPVAKAAELVDEYEITPGYKYTYNEDSDTVDITEEPWVVKDDAGVDSHSLLAPPVVLTFIKQLVQALEIEE